jgi:hypothetical protein
LDDGVDYWEAHPEPSDVELAELAEAWVRYQSAEGVDADREDDADWWACQAVISVDPARPDLEWRVLRCLCEAADPPSEKTVGSIGAGPLEDFLWNQGADALDLIEPAADSDPVLLDALT